MRNETDEAIRVAIANAIELNLIKYRAGRVKETTFVEDASKDRPELNYHKNIRDRALRAAWVFADSFFDAANEGFSDLDHKPWPLAEELIEDVLDRMKSGRTVDDERVLRYGDL